jgi:hypothetical protein
LIATQVAEGLDKADRDFGVRRSIIKILDVKATLSVEDEKQVDYARYVLGK